MTRASSPNSVPPDREPAGFDHRRGDQPSGGSVTESRLRTPTLAAWDAGRSFNHLRFRLEQVWLVGIDPQPATTEGIWDDLALAVRELGIPVAEADSLRDVVVEHRRSWEGQCGSLWHHEKLLEKSEELRRRMRQDPSLSSFSLYEIVWRQVLGEVSDLVEGLQHGLECRLSEELLAVFRLAQFVDQGIRPGWLDQPRLDLPEVPSQEGQRSQAASGGGNRTEREQTGAASTPGAAAAGPRTETPRSWMDRDAAEPRRWPFLREVHEVSQTPPAARWFREIDQRWQQVGLPADNFPQFASTAAYDTIQPVCDYIDRLDHVARRHLGGLPPELQGPQEPDAPLDEGPETEPASSPFGLCIDWERCTVTRDGRRAREDLRRPLLWGLFKCFVQNHGRPVSLEKLRSQWADFGGRAGDPEDATIYGALSELSGLLSEGVGLWVGGRPNLGWQLTDNRPPNRRRR